MYIHIALLAHICHIYVCLYVCVYIYTHVYVYMCVYLYFYLSLYMYIHTYIYIYITAICSFMIILDMHVYIYVHLIIPAVAVCELDYVVWFSCDEQLLIWTLLTGGQGSAANSRLVAIMCGFPRIRGPFGESFNWPSSYILVYLGGPCFWKPPCTYLLPCSAQM